MAVLKTTSPTVWPLMPIEIPENVIKYIIEEYTYESGVRKLKEIFI
jgi:ATP-dependent Lon protease